MKVGDMIKMVAGIPGKSKTGLLVDISWAPPPDDKKRIASVMTDKGLETWPLDSDYAIAVIDSREGGAS